MLEFAVKPIPYTPHDYQKKAIKFCVSQGAGGLFLDPGLGKSSVSLATYLVLKGKGLVDSVLIIAPMRVCYSVWPKEIAKWVDFNGLTYEVLHGPKKNDALLRKADVYLINPEGLEWYFKNVKKLPQMLVIDESTRFKNSGTKRFKLLKPHLPKFKRRYILTGTPVPNGFLDLFGQIYMLDQGAALGRYITHYRNNFFYSTGFGGYEWRLTDDGAERIEKRIRPLTLRLSAEDYLTLPELVHNEVRVDLPEKAMRIYKDIENEFISMIDSATTLVVGTASAASIKLRQIANGSAYSAIANGERETLFIHDAKLEAVESILEELNGRPVLIAYEFQHDLEQLRKLLGKDVPYIGGGVTPKRATELEQAWNAGELPVLLGHPASFGHGLNLQESGNHLIWYSIPWDLELLIQVIDRLHRQGQKASHVFVHYLIARGTIDEVVLKVVRGKNKTQTSLLNALKEYAHGGL